MSQIQAGHVALTSGSSTVTAEAGIDWSQVTTDCVFFAAADQNARYAIVDVTHKLDNPPVITIGAPYAGLTDPAAAYAIQKDFTPNFHLPYINGADIATRSLLRLMADIIDANMGAGGGGGSSRPFDDAVYPGNANYTVDGSLRSILVEYSTALSTTRTVTLANAGIAGNQALIYRSSAATGSPLTVTGFYTGGSTAMALDNTGAWVLAIYDGATNRWRVGAYFDGIGSGGSGTPGIPSGLESVGRNLLVADHLKVIGVTAAATFNVTATAGGTSGWRVALVQRGTGVITVTMDGTLSQVGGGDLSTFRDGQALLIEALGSNQVLVTRRAPAGTGIGQVAIFSDNGSGTPALNGVDLSGCIFPPSSGYQHMTPVPIAGTTDSNVTDGSYRIYSNVAAIAVSISDSTLVDGGESAAHRATGAGLITLSPSGGITSINGVAAAVTCKGICPIRRNGTDLIIGGDIAAAKTLYGKVNFDDPTSGAGLVDEHSGHIEIPSIKSYFLTRNITYTRNLLAFYVLAGSGSCTIDIRINGTVVTGMSAIAASTVFVIATATAANACPLDGKIELVVTANSSCQDLTFTLKYIRT